MQNYSQNVVHLWSFQQKELHYDALVMSATDFCTTRWK